MPLYPYRCLPCNHAFDRLKPFARAAEPETCPQCGVIADRLFLPTTSIVPGGTNAGKSSRDFTTLKDLDPDDSSDWVYS